MHLQCATKEEMEVYGLSVRKSNFISVTLTVNSLRSGSATRSGMEVCFGVYKRCVCGAP